MARASRAVRSGRKVSTITASSLVSLAPMLASMRPGCGPWGIPSGWRVMLPYSMVFLVGWSLMFAVWLVLGLPIGPNAPLHFVP